MSHRGVLPLSIEQSAELALHRPDVAAGVAKVVGYGIKVYVVGNGMSEVYKPPIHDQWSEIREKVHTSRAQEQSTAEQGEQ